MHQNSAPAYPPGSDDDRTNAEASIQMATYTCISALVLFATFVIVVTRFRWWHNNLILKKIPELVNNPVNSLINQGIGVAAAYQYQNDLYLLWVVLLFIAYDNAFTVSSYSFLEQVSERRSRELVFVYNCILMVYLICLYRGSKHDFFPPLLALWSIVVVKFLLRIVSYVRAERAYGLGNTQKIADYMKSEYELTDTTGVDPTHMQGYKYLILGEDNINSTVEAPEYTTKIELTADVVTVEGIWSCKKGLLHRSFDTEKLKDVCLSFSLFKLLRRQYFGYPAAEAQQPKTKQLVFGGLLSAPAANQGQVDKQRVFRVIKMELGFMRDFIFTRYPVGFAWGFPVFNLVLLSGMMGVTIWIAIKVFQDHKYPKITNDSYPNQEVVERRITDVLLILIAVMEILEAVTYVFSDWTKVILVCQNVRKFSHTESQLAHSDTTGPPEPCRSLFIYKILATFCKPRFSLSVNNILGQYKLLTNCKKHSKMTCQLTVSKAGGTRRLRGLKKGKAVKVSECVTNSIFDTLVRSRGDIKNVKAVLNGYGGNIYNDVQREVDLKKPVHTIMVWHIATSFCEIYSEKHGGNKVSIDSDQRAATQLSNYCAYLVAFRPDLLPLTVSNSVKFMFWKIHEETCNFLNGELGSDRMYEKMMSCRADDQKIIHRGSELGRYLTENIPEDAQRWKMMADFWSAFILYLAPSGSTRAHIEQLANGSEFITHLWALLYHAGITPATIDEDYP